MEELELREQERSRLRFVPYPEAQDEDPQLTDQDLRRTGQWATQQSQWLEEESEVESEDQEEEYFPYPEESWQEKRARLKDELRQFESQGPSTFPSRRSDGRSTSVGRTEDQGISSYRSQSVITTEDTDPKEETVIEIIQ